MNSLICELIVQCFNQHSVFIARCIMIIIFANGWSKYSGECKKSSQIHRWCVMITKDASVFLAVMGLSWKTLFIIRCWITDVHQVQILPCTPGEQKNTSQQYYYLRCTKRERKKIVRSIARYRYIDLNIHTYTPTQINR